MPEGGARGSPGSWPALLAFHVESTGKLATNLNRRKAPDEFIAPSAYPRSAAHKLLRRTGHRNKRGHRRPPGLQIAFPSLRGPAYRFVETLSRQPRVFPGVERTPARTVWVRIGVLAVLLYSQLGSHLRGSADTLLRPPRLLLFASIGATFTTASCIARRYL